MLSGRFDLVILDVIADGDGIELLRQLRANQNHGGNSVILLSRKRKWRAASRSRTAQWSIGKP
jgi:DNA-binding response OmpR family regulator